MKLAGKAKKVGTGTSFPRGGEVPPLLHEWKLVPVPTFLLLVSLVSPARRSGVFLTPTVLFLDGKGQSLAEPLVGVSNVDFYLYYLERRISQSRLKLSH